MSDARRAFFQVQGPGPIGLEQAGARRPVNVLHVGERMPGRQGRAVGGAIHPCFEFAVLPAVDTAMEQPAGYWRTMKFRIP